MKCQIATHQRVLWSSVILMSLSGCMVSGTGDAKVPPSIERDSESDTVADSSDGVSESLGDAEELEQPESEILNNRDSDAVVPVDSETAVTVDSEVVCEGCLIDGICYAALDSNPQNICEVCMPENAQSAWSSNDGASCDDGEFCNGEARCTAEGTCVAGEPISCESEYPCATAECDEENDVCSYIIEEGTCLIENECYASGAQNPENNCETCRPTEHQGAWSATIEGNSCGYCLACNGEGACTKSPSCCATRESDVYEGFCTTAPQLFIGNGCGVRRDWFRRGADSYAYGVDAYFCDGGIWMKDSALAVTHGVECSECDSPLYEEQWQTYNCSMEVATQEYSCEEAIVWE